MSSISRQLVAPKHFKANNIISFINDCQPVFRLVNKAESDFLLDLSRITECSMIGLLVVYKIVEYATKNKCFISGYYLTSVAFEDAMQKYGFSNLIKTYLKDLKVNEDEFTKLKVSITDRFIIAPQALVRNDRYSGEMLNKNYLPQIEQYYSKNVKGISMIFSCFCEVLLNFWEHAIDDTQSIIVANGNQSNIEIGCADTGRGVVTTLTMAGKKRKDSISTLSSAVEKGVTSKDMTSHMGYGLWIIDEISRITKGRFHLYSEGCYYQREFGKVYSGKCGYWQGTIIYLSLPLKNPVTLSDIETPDKVLKDKINWT